MTIVLDNATSSRIKKLWSETGHQRESDVHALYRAINAFRVPQWLVTTHTSNPQRSLTLSAPKDAIEPCSDTKPLHAAK